MTHEFDPRKWPRDPRDPRNLAHSPGAWGTRMTNGNEWPRMTNEFDPRVWPTIMTHDNDPREWPTSLTHENDPRDPRDPRDLAHSFSLTAAYVFFLFP